MSVHLCVNIDECESTCECMYTSAYVCMFTCLCVYEYVLLGSPSSRLTSAHMGCLLWVSVSTWVKNSAVNVPTPVTWWQIHEAWVRNSDCGASLPLKNLRGLRQDHSAQDISSPCPWWWHLFILYALLEKRLLHQEHCSFQNRGEVRHHRNDESQETTCWWQAFPELLLLAETLKTSVS